MKMIHALIPALVLSVSAGAVSAKVIASGDADPLAGGGALIQLLGQRYHDAGLADVTVKLYPGGRHEILNETNRDEVTADIVAWLRAHAG